MGNTRSDIEHVNLRKETYSIYRKAIYSKSLIPSSVCENCLSKELIHGHHVDYNKPLEVVWLCRACHMKIHSSCDFVDCSRSREFQNRTSSELSQEDKQRLYQRLDLNKFRRIPIKERCTQDERAKLEEYKTRWNQFMIEHFRAKDMANFYYEKMQVLEAQLSEKYPHNIENLY